MMFPLPKTTLSMFFHGFNPAKFFVKKSIQRVNSEIVVHPQTSHKKLLPSIFKSNHFGSWKNPPSKVVGWSNHFEDDFQNHSPPAFCSFFLLVARYFLEWKMAFPVAFHECHKTNNFCDCHVSYQTMQTHTNFQGYPYQWYSFWVGNIMTPFCYLPF